jgi:hypothetical protein
MICILGTEEFRIEVYIPPYLIQGLQRPSFTISNTDWSYNGQYSITVSLSQGTDSTVRVSLVAGGYPASVNFSSSSSLVLQQPQAHMVTRWAAGLSSLHSRARSRSVRLSRLPTPLFALLVGTCCLSSMASLPPSEHGYGLVEIQRRWAIGLLGTPSRGLAYKC